MSNNIVKQQNSNGHLKFEDIIPTLAGLYRQGLLVPFIGAGMSYGVCCGWNQLLKNLAAKTAVRLPSHSKRNGLSSSEIIRVADEIIMSLRPYKAEVQIKIYQDALAASPSSKKIPDQMNALTELYWPLTLTTNYDDVFWYASGANKTISTAENLKDDKQRNIEVLGRSISDCHQILRSLDGVNPSVLWALQGFVGGQLTTADQVISDTGKRIDLASQIVLGHQQYQKVINSSLHFRRAFSEVFRRRSLLFLGSGMLEDYLVNLFSETLHNQGAGPYPHFALLESGSQSKYDYLFMQQRLGIVPIFYNSHEELPGLLRQFSSVIKYWLDKSPSVRQPSAPFIFQDEIGFSLAGKCKNETIPVKVSLCKSVLPIPNLDNSECSVVSVGRFHNAPLIGTQAQSHIIAFHNKYQDMASKTWINVDKDPSFVFRYGEYPIFGIAARQKDMITRSHDSRDLSVIPDAVCDLLRETDAAGFETIHIGPIAAGRKKPWHPIHPFAQSLRGIMKFIDGHQIGQIKRINMYIIDPATWAAIISRKIHLEALLTSKISSHVIETTDANGLTEVFNITLKELPTLGELLKACKINPDLWNVKVFPSPSDGSNDVLESMTITSTMKLILTAKAFKYKNTN
ncbi:MAG: hypothetical protein JWM28_3129 [Chitinophagaceae bacterium]|nr:hypothetical protein [Chitinophagaceae bacterium]